MKKVLTTLVLIACFSGLSAQYKKASFFEKSGRTYGIGATMFALGDGKGAPIGVNLSFGRDQDGKRLFSFWGFHFIPGWKFKYETVDFDANPVTVSGKAKLHWILESNYGWYILKNEEEQVFKPFLTAGFNIVLLGGLKELDNEDLQGNTVKQVPTQNFSVGAGAGLGGIINFASNWQLKVQGGYTYQGNVNTDVSDNSEAYNLFTSHPYASLGIRYRIVAE